MERSPPCWEGSGEPRSPCVILISDRVLPSPKGCRAFVPPSQPSPRPAATPLPPPPSPEGCPGGPGGQRGCRGKRPTVASERAASLPARPAGPGEEVRGGRARLVRGAPSGAYPRFHCCPQAGPSCSTWPRVDGSEPGAGL